MSRQARINGKRSVKKSPDSNANQQMQAADDGVLFDVLARVRGVKQFKSRRRWPVAKAEAEVIARYQFMIDMTGETAVAKPVLLLLGNRDGLEYLSKLLWCLADRMRSGPKYSDDPDDHQHILFEDPPFNQILGSSGEIRVGILTKDNRSRVLKKYGIAKATRQPQDLLSTYQEILENARDMVERNNVFLKKWHSEQRLVKKAIRRRKPSQPGRS